MTHRHWILNYSSLEGEIKRNPEQFIYCGSGKTSRRRREYHSCQHVLTTTTTLDERITPNGAADIRPQGAGWARRGGKGRCGDICMGSSLLHRIVSCPPYLYSGGTKTPAIGKKRGNTDHHENICSWGGLGSHGRCSRIPVEGGQPEFKSTHDGALLHSPSRTIRLNLWMSYK